MRLREQPKHDNHKSCFMSDNNSKSASVHWSYTKSTCNMKFIMSVISFWKYVCFVTDTKEIRIWDELFLWYITWIKKMNVDCNQTFRETAIEVGNLQRLYCPSYSCRY